MEIKTATSFAGFLVTLATLNMPAAIAFNLQAGEERSPSRIDEISTAPTAASPIDRRLARLTAALREREAQLPESQLPSESKTLAAGWGNRSGGAWINTRRGGWGDRRGGGGFANINPWRNGWGDRGGFYNYNPWRNGGGRWIDHRW